MNQDIHEGLEKEEPFLFSKICRAAALCFMLLACLSAILPQSSEAAKREAVHKLNYFQSYETEVDGRQALRIEIGMDRDNVTYDVTAHPYLQKQLVIDLSNTEPDKLKSDYEFSSKFAKALHIRELEARHTQVRIDCKNPVMDGSYAVHAEPADRKAKKPYRLVIDIFASGGTASSSRVAGVSGHSIVIDPGHGGSDTGAVGPTGVTEASVTLAVSKDLQSILENSGARVTMTRDKDVDVYGPYASDRQELQARVNVGEYTPGAEIFVSIHCNAFSNPAWRRTTTRARRRASASRPCSMKSSRRPAASSTAASRRQTSMSSSTRACRRRSPSSPLSRIPRKSSCSQALRTR
jgi:N-acetylmuramoyl-L-alanine amidase